MPAKKAKNTLSKADMEKELIALDRVANALNTAIVALMYVCKVKGNELDKVTGEEYVKFVQEHIHPLVRRADEISKEVAEKAAKSAKEAAGEK